MKVYETLIRYHPDGTVGAHVQYYQDDGETPQPRVYPISTPDFPHGAITLAEHVGEQSAALVVAADAALQEKTRLEGELEKVAEEVGQIMKDKQAVTEVAQQALARLAPQPAQQAFARLAPQPARPWWKLW